MCLPIDGNAEADNNDDGAGTMECVYFGTWNATRSGWCGGSGLGPWVMAGEFTTASVTDFSLQPLPLPALNVGLPRQT